MGTAIGYNILFKIIVVFVIIFNIDKLVKKLDSIFFKIPKKIISEYY